MRRTAARLVLARSRAIRDSSSMGSRGPAVVAVAGAGARIRAEHDV
jgi:hypothetical protein